MIVCQDVHVATITASDAIAGRFKFPEPVTGVNINEFARVQTPDDFKLRFFECFDEDANQVRFYAQLATETCQHLGWVGRDGLHNPWNPTA